MLKKQPMGADLTLHHSDSAFGRKGDLERHIASTHQAIDPPEAVCPKWYVIHATCVEPLT
jgi:hypothetical protein